MVYNTGCSDRPRPTIYIYDYVLGPSQPKHSMSPVPIVYDL